MLDWLKGILGDAYTDDIDKKVSAEIGKGFVARTDFNTVNEAKKQLEADLKERNTQLETLKATTGDAEELKKQITQLQNENAEKEKTNAEAIKALRLEGAAEMALVKAGAKNVKIAMAALDMGKLKIADDGTVTGLDEQITELTKGADTSFLFEAPGGKGGKPIGFKPADGGKPSPAGGKAKEPKDMTYEELCKYLEENPTALN